MAALSVDSYAYIDESGGLDQGHFVMGGFVAGVEAWKAFSDDWEAVLEQDPVLPSFHAVDFEAEEGSFEVFRGEKEAKAERMASFVNVIMKHSPQPVLAVIGIDDFKRRVPPRSKEKRKRRSEWWKYPYTYAAAHIVGALADLHEEINRDLGSIEVVFDWMEQFHKPAAKLLQEAVISEIETQSAKHAGRLGTPRWPRPDERAKYLPIQAADLLVWHQRRALDYKDGETRRAWRELKQLRPRYIESAKGRDTLGKWIYGHSQGSIIPPPPEGVQ